jgi:hypothetical protein
MSMDNLVCDSMKVITTCDKYLETLKVEMELSPNAEVPMSAF